LASAAFVDSIGSANALTRDNSYWKTLFLAWPFENLIQANADELMAATMDWFTIPPNPTAGFSTSHTVATIGETITFTNTSLNATTYLWDFGDGVTSTLTNPTHIYTTPMTATIKLKASNCCGTGETSLDIMIQSWQYLPLISKPGITEGNSAKSQNGIVIILTSLAGFGLLRITPRRKKAT